MRPASRLACLNVDLDGLRHYAAIHGLAEGALPPGAVDAVARLAPDRLCDALADRGLKGTFFAIGEDLITRREGGEVESPGTLLAGAAPLRRAAAAGHEIGNHTRNHRKLHRLGPGAVKAELTGGHKDIVEITGEIPRAFRAPHGYRNPFVTRVANKLRYRTVGWTYGVWDSDRPPPEEIRRRVRVKLKPGAIVLLHDGDGYDPAGTSERGDRSNTATALPGIIADARDAGYEFRSLGELLR